jgi:hypothetical protein
MDTFYWPVLLQTLIFGICKHLEIFRPFDAANGFSRSALFHVIIQLFEVVRWRVIKYEYKV